MPTKCILLFSGGLDSVIAAHLLRAQGIEVIALHFVLPFDVGRRGSLNAVKQFAGALGVRLIIEEDGPGFVAMLKNPVFGFGKHANPCIDCRIRRLKAAHMLMQKEQAAFIATGEVIGQRPMSQRRDRLSVIENRSELAGILLRPLSAKMLDPTIAETEGLVNRDLLLGISGRGRKEQLAYAQRYNLEHFPPAGGCMLTYDDAAVRLADLSSHCKDYGLNDLCLLGLGRHFRISPALRLIVARDEAETIVLETLFQPDDYRVLASDRNGPVCLARGTAASEEEITRCARICVRYGSARSESFATVMVERNGETRTIVVAPLHSDECETCRIAARSIRESRL